MSDAIQRPIPLGGGGGISKNHPLQPFCLAVVEAPCLAFLIRPSLLEERFPDAVLFPGSGCLGDCIERCRVAVLVLVYCLLQVSLV